MAGTIGHGEIFAVTVSADGGYVPRMSAPFEVPKVKNAYPDRSAIIRGPGHRHLIVDIDALLATIESGGGTSGGIPVVDGATGQVVAIAHPDPVDGVMTYVDPTPVIVTESSGGTNVSPSGGGTVRVTITPAPTEPRESGPPAEVEPLSTPQPFTKPRCDGFYCFVKTACHPGLSTSIRIRSQPLFNATNVGGKTLRVSFVDASQAVISEVDIPPGNSAGSLVPPPGADSIYVACDGSGDSTLRFEVGVG